MKSGSESVGLHDLKFKMTSVRPLYGKIATSLETQRPLHITGKGNSIENGIHAASVKMCLYGRNKYQCWTL